MNEEMIPMVSKVGMDQFIKVFRQNGVKDETIKEMIEQTFAKAIREAFERN